MPSKKDPAAALVHIAENIRFAQKLIADMSYEEFRDNQTVFYAATRALEIISEASRRVAPAIKARHAHIPWADVAGAGNIYRHDYEDVQQKLIWGTIQKRLPELLAIVEAEIAPQ